MNKRVYLPILLTAFSICSIVVFSNINRESSYQPRTNASDSKHSIKGAAEYMNALRANQITGVVDLEDVRAAQEEIARTRSLHKAGFPLKWQSAGPDNIGGRTRAVLIDRNNNNILYAGGVMGGLWKSTNKGASWYPINDQFDNMAIASICQTKNGNIYFGTGETFIGNGGQKGFTPGFSGNGIYKSTDGETFAKIITTSSWSYVNKLAVLPNTNTIIAATSSGLQASNDGDDTKWTLVQGGGFEDLAIDRNGNVIASNKTRVFRSTSPTTNGSYSIVNGLANVSGNSRISVAVSPSDPNYVYAICAGSVTVTSPSRVNLSSGLIGLYQSKDNGQNFTEIVGPANTYFSPFSSINSAHSQGYYDNVIAVHPRKKEHVYIGGIGFAQWTKEAGPEMIGNTFDSPFNPFGIHSDKHVIIFDTVSNPMIMYVSSDGGVAKTTNSELTRFANLYNGYQTTQFYDIAAGVDGAIIGGTQDNNTIYINGKGNTPQAGTAVWGGDGFQCAISRINPDVLFMESQYGSMARSFNAGGNGGNIWDERIKKSFIDGTEPGLVANEIFNTPLELWEDETTMKSKLFFALDAEIWMALDASVAPSPVWFKLGNVSNAHTMEFTPDGNSLFINTFSSSNIYRIDGIAQTNWDTTEIAVDQIPPTLSMRNIRGNLPNRTVTDLEIDENNPNRLIVTMGNYGNGNYIYITNNALDEIPTWASIDGNLPNAPIYCAEINVANSAEIIIGTEFGVYVTSNGMATSPSWTPNNSEFPNVPVFSLAQVEVKKWTNTKRTGPVIYAGTHGRGIFVSNTLLTSVPSVSKNLTPLAINTYPNPTSDVLTVSFESTTQDKVAINVRSMSGQIVSTQKIDAMNSSNNSVRFNVKNLPAGAYLIEVKGSTLAGSSKFVKLD